MIRNTLAALFLIMLGSSAGAQQCLDKLTMDAQLQAKFGEIEFAQALSDANAVKFYGNPKNRTWSIVVVTPSGMACLLAAGEDLEMVLGKSMPDEKPL